MSPLKILSSILASEIVHSVGRKAETKSSIPLAERPRLGLSTNGLDSSLANIPNIQDKLEKYDVMMAHEFGS